VIAIVFDPHCWPHKRFGGELKHGINRRGQLTLQTLNRAVAVANEHDAELVVAGDLVDSAGPVLPQFAAALRASLEACNNRVHLLLGNHDMVADSDHSLGIYESHQGGEGVKVVSTIQRWARLDSRANFDSFMSPPITGQVVLVPFNADLRDSKVRDCPLLIGHFGVYDDAFPPWLKSSKGAWHVDALFEFMKERNIKVACLGDWHQRNAWYKPYADTRLFKEPTPGSGSVGWLSGAPIILQGGALNATGWDNPGLHGYGTVALWDGERLNWQELPGPRFCTVHSDEEEAATIAEAAQLGHNLFLRRFYQGKRPQRPSGVEAYEALPQAIESAARKAVQATTRARLGMEAQAITRLIHEWVCQIERTDGLEYAEAVEQLIKEYT